MIHRERRAIVVTRGCLEKRLRTEDDVMDFVGDAAERLLVVQLWDEIQAEGKARREARA